MSLEYGEFKANSILRTAINRGAEHAKEVTKSIFTKPSGK
jgi:hypothetical protein